MKKRISGIYNLYTSRRDVPKEFTARDMKSLEDAKVATLFHYWV